MTATVARLGDPTRHFWLTRSVARAMDLNLSEAMAAGRLTPVGYARMVTNCRKCQHAERCIAWLAENGAGAEAASDFCANADTLNTLRREMVRAG